MNLLSGGCIKINEQIYELVKNCKSSNEIKLLSEEYGEDDRLFLSCLADQMELSGLYSVDSLSRIKRVDYVMTNLCNLNCRHCCLSATPISYDKVQFSANMDIIKKIICLNPETITLTGGEPLIVKNIYDILKHLRKNYAGQVVLATNATLIDNSNAELLCECIHHFDISIDGYDEKSTSLIRGAGVYGKVVNAIQILKNYGAKSISLSAVFTNSTKVQMERFVDFCSELGVKPITRYMNLTGRAATNGLEDATEIVNFLTPEVRDVHLCTAGIDIIAVTENGTVYPCVNMMENEFVVGNILDANISEKLSWNEDLSWFRNFSQYISLYRDECSECEVNGFCWNCPASAYNFIKDKKINQLNRFCQSKKDRMMEALWNE